MDVTFLQLVVLLHNLKIGSLAFILRNFTFEVCYQGLAATLQLQRNGISVKMILRIVDNFNYVIC